jgi:hypothetical protein
MKPKEPKPGPVRPPHRSKARPKPGTAGAGKIFDPAHPAEDREPEAATRAVPRPAPAPGVPVSGREYERLKERAKTSHIPRSKRGQEDPSGKR